MHLRPECIWGDVHQRKQTPSLAERKFFKGTLPVTLVYIRHKHRFMSCKPAELCKQQPSGKQSGFPLGTRMQTYRRMARDLPHSRVTCNMSISNVTPTYQVPVRLHDRVLRAHHF